MTDHILLGVSALLIAILSAAIAALATRVRLLPEVIDISMIPTGAGVGSIAFIVYGACRGFEPERLARLSLGGTVVGGVAGAGVLAIGLVIDVL